MQITRKNNTHTISDIAGAITLDTQQLLQLRSKLNSYCDKLVTDILSMQDAEQPSLTIPQALEIAKIQGVELNRGTVQYQATSGGIRAEKVGNKWMMVESDFRRWLEAKS